MNCKRTENAPLNAQAQAMAVMLARNTTVLTPTRRLASTLLRDFDQAQIVAGRTVWTTPNILPISSFIAELYDAVLHDPRAGELPQLLTPAQSSALWEESVRRGRAELLSPAGAAVMAAHSWATAHQWDIAGRVQAAAHTEDCRAWLDWALRYTRRLDELDAIDSVRLPDRVAALIERGVIALPSEICLAGFDALTAQQARLMSSIEAAGISLQQWQPQVRAASVRCVQALDARDEEKSVALWARQRVEQQPGCTVGILVPDLAARRESLRRAFARALTPGRIAPEVGSAPYNISLGVALGAFPMVTTALRALRLAADSLPFEEASELLRSPFLVAADSELDARANFDAEWRRVAEPHVTLERLSRQLARSESVPQLAARVRSLQADRRERGRLERAPSEWLRVFAKVLELWGFPGERNLDSAEYQTLARWHDLLAEFAGLERFVRRMSFSAAVARVARMASDAIYQPESPPDAPIQILGFIEAQGLSFGHLWVMGMSEDAWPAPARPDPFLPIELQRAAGIPHATAGAQLARAQRLMQQWRGAADELVFSYAQREGERKILPSPLLAQLVFATDKVPTEKLPSASAAAAARLPSFIDVTAPPLPIAARLTGGASILQDQAACPFRAFARHRLLARALITPKMGLNAAERGNLVHKMLARFWASLEEPSRTALMDLDVEHCGALLRAAAAGAVEELAQFRPDALEGRFAVLERDRLLRLSLEWLDRELAERRDFRVIAIEARREISIGPLHLAARLDRVDEDEDGVRIIIDYKTGRTASPLAWMGTRPDEPQLPLYLVASEHSARAIAFAQVKTGESKLVALADTDDRLPARHATSWAREFADWHALVAAWRMVLEKLAHEFAEGAAMVDPKVPGKTCAHCDLQMLCRIHERAYVEDEVAGETDAD